MNRYVRHVYCPLNPARVAASQLVTASSPRAPSIPAAQPVSNSVATSVTAPAPTMPLLAIIEDPSTSEDFMEATLVQDDDDDVFDVGDEGGRVVCSCTACKSVTLSNVNMRTLLQILTAGISIPVPNTPGWEELLSTMPSNQSEALRDNPAIAGPSRIEKGERDFEYTMLIIYLQKCD